MLSKLIARLKFATYLYGPQTAFFAGLAAVAAILLWVALFK